MATLWTPPKTWSTGDILTAADLDLYLRDNTSWLATDKPSCRVFNSAAISVPNGSDTPLTFDSERYDNQNMHSTVTNTDRLTVPTGMAGKYLLTAHIEFPANGTGTRIVGIKLNAATVLARSFSPGNGTDAADMTVATIWAASAGDFFQCMARQSSGGALNVNAASNYSPEFTATWLST